MENLQNTVNSLPQMSRDIVDDTIHEKVLSYLSEYASQGPDMVATFMQWNVLDVIPKLLENDDKKNALLFNKIIESYHDVLDFISENAFAEEGSLRYSCYEALEQIVSYENGAKWFFHTNKSSQIVSACFLDSNTYVTTTASKLLLSIINNSTISTNLNDETVIQNELLNHLISTLDIFDIIKRLLFNPSEDIGERLATLQLIWILINSKTENSYEFIKRGQLVIIRSRTIDILCDIFMSPEPISLLKTSLHSIDPIDETFEFIVHEIVFSLFNTDKNVEMITVAVNVIESLIILVDRVEVSNKEIYASRLMDVLIILLEFSKIRESKETLFKHVINPDIQLLIFNGTYEKLRTLFLNIRKNIANRKSIILSILHAISTIYHKYNSLVMNTTIDIINIILDILFIPNYNSDQRILKAGLSVIPIILFSKIINNQITDPDNINKTLKMIRDLITDSKIECRGIILLLETMEVLLNNNIIGQYILDSEYGEIWADAIIFKSCDYRWEIRDSILEFIGRLFEKNTFGVKFALKFNLPLTVMSKITDNVAYVRASSLTTIQVYLIIRRSDGWQYIMSQNLQEKISSQLPFMIKDTEAFVRRAVMELMICLISERECGSLLLADHNKEIMNPLVMDKIMDDPDFYVRIAGCQFLEVVWFHCEQDRIKSGNQIFSEILLLERNSSWFYMLNGDKLLLAAVDDFSRLVRREIIDILDRLKLYFGNNDSIQELFSLLKSKHNIIPEKKPSLMKSHLEFYQKICLVDFDRLKSTIDVEHLYKEALETVNSSMMVADIVEEGNEFNALDCYF
ncbi:1905_t:CDS:10 [Diversispora eburnea]|uniref:1905_t:CDS:1 n=1 Tax=Diversispora eburnea TaxID=1213867 RepID=A0A9N8YVN9_9GLOM|nr:1905_t:CDS:10 [Diversispora eburnea]